MYQSHQFPLASLSSLQLVETSSSLAPDFVLATGHSPSLVLRCGTVCRPIFDLHQHSAPSRIDSRLICFYSRILYFESHQLNSSSVCCTAPLYCLYGHVTAPYKLSYYYYYYVNCTMCVACCRAYRRDLYDIDEDSQDYERRILPAPLPPRSAHVHFRLALRYTV